MRALQLHTTAHIDEVLHSLHHEQSAALETVALRLAALPAPESDHVPVTPRDTLLGLPAGAVVDVEPEPEPEPED